jgi:hypothetical protein
VAGVLGQHPRPEPDEALHLRGRIFGAKVKMNAVLHRFRLGNKLEEQARAGTVGTLHQHRRIILRIIDPVGPQARQFRLVIRGNRVSVQRGRPEPRDRRRMPAINNDVMKPSHQAIMHRAGGAHPSPARTGSPGCGKHRQP